MEWSFAGGAVQVSQFQTRGPAAAELAEPPVRGLPLAYLAQPQFPADAAASAGLFIVPTNNWSLSTCPDRTKNSSQEEEEWG